MLVVIWLIYYIALDWPRGVHPSWERPIKSQWALGLYSTRVLLHSTKPIILPRPLEIEQVFTSKVFFP
jgi:hypothetical protein